jgi:uncharacterized protein YkwD
MDIGWPLRHRRGAWLIAGLVAIAFAALLAIGPTPRAASALTNCSVDASIDGEEQAFLGLINSYRHDHGQDPLSLSDSLNRSAAWKAEDMADNDYFAHNDDPISRTWVDRVRDCGYGANTYIGENLAAGNQAAADAFNQWQNSPAHNENMLNENYVVIGIARAHNSDSTYGWYWVTDFGGEAEHAPPPPSNGVHNGDVDCNNRTDPIDASLVLQRSAGMTASLPCQSDADVNEDGVTTPIDAVLILQYAAGLVPSLPV